MPETSSFFPPDSTSFSSPTDTVSRLEAVLFCARLGLRVHPLHPRSKKPHLKHYPRKATTDETQIRRWAARFPDCNWGCVAGKSSGVCVLDVDRRHGGEASLQQLEAQYGPLPLTWQVETSDGWHLYFRLPANGLHGEVLHGLSGVELLTNGHNVLLPGSIHPSGAVYTWSVFHPTPTLLTLADAPAWLMAEEGVFQNVQNRASHKSYVKREGDSVTSTAGVEIKALLADWGVVQRILPLLGLHASTRPGQSFLCVVHPEGHPSAAILKPTVEGVPYVYADFHERDGRRVYQLVSVYYALKTSQDLGALNRDYGDPGFYVWTVRMLYEAGVISRSKVHAPKLPEWLLKSAPPFAHEVYAVVCDLISVRWRREYGAPFPLSWGFVRNWAKSMGYDVPKNAIGRVICWLLGGGILRWVARHKNTSLFLFGTRPYRMFRRRRRQPPTRTKAELEERLEAEAQAAPASRLGLRDPVQHASPGEHGSPVCSNCAAHRVVEGCDDCKAFRGQQILLNKRRQLGLQE